jgi:hypothetical protein
MDRSFLPAVPALFALTMCSCAILRYTQVQPPEKYPQSAQIYLVDQNIRDWDSSFARTIENELAKASWITTQINSETAKINSRKFNQGFWPTLVGGIAGIASTFYTSVTEAKDQDKRITVGLSLAGSTVLLGLLPTNSLDNRIKELETKKNNIMTERNGLISTCNDLSNTLMTLANAKMASAPDEKQIAELHLKAQSFQNSANLKIQQLDQTLSE